MKTFNAFEFCQVNCQVSERILSFYNTASVNPLYSWSSDALKKYNSPENMSLVKT